VLPGYPQPIRDFALHHLRDIGIKVWTEARASKVGRDAISIYDKPSNTTKDLPYGLIVWATGVAPGPLIQKLISKISEQSSFRTLKTDAFCKVVGADGVFALGDCADIDVLAAHQNGITKLFDEVNRRYPGGTDRSLSKEANDAFLTELEQKLAAKISAPGAKIVKELSQMFDNAKKRFEQNGGVFDGLTKEAVQNVVKSQMERQKFLPPTAQVAHQQGEYLAGLLNNPKIDDQTNLWSYDHGNGFELHDLGQLVYVGGHMAALNVPGRNNMDLSWNGSLTNFIWHAAYFGMLESISGRAELLFDWTKTSIFGRSTALDAICSADSSSHVDSLPRGGRVCDEKPQIKASWWKRWG
jgi:NADH:ubiquinone reductase (non-electrogenic)